ncbi:MAG TPA: ATP-binding protein [Methylotenera sp.]|nr:ATP-binding protein [Methylotenera sp.]HPH04543.1 ATP-binding protein [Methylotenera sp.]HPN00783.1 ATP-binding protein [Methylotenera sp.]
MFSKLITQLKELPLQARAINVMNVFRLVLSLTFVGLYVFLSQETWWGKNTIPLFFSISIGYLVFSILAILISYIKLAKHHFILPLQVVMDIGFITLLMFAAGGIQSGLGLLLIVTIVSASLVSNGRLALFYASVASIFLLLEQSYRFATETLNSGNYTPTVMLSLSCFATAWLAYSLGTRMLDSEALASSRGIDLENLAQVNALITQEMQDGVLVVNEQLNIRHYNLQAETLLSLPKASTTQLSLKQHAPEISSALRQWVLTSSANNNVISIGNRELQLRFMPIHQQRNKGAVIFIQDFSQIQAKSQQAKLAAMGRLTANIAHEIRNPLSAISHANQLMQEDDNAPATKRILQIVEDNIGRIDQIIKDVLELNRRDRTQQVKIELSTFLKDFYAQFCAVENITPMHFLLEPLLYKQTITFDQRHLTQILWNLCKNGWQHSQKQVGSLSLGCDLIGKSGINIRITDDGSGVAKEDRQKLFEPFFTTKSSGNGLGLYISRELAEANGATLKYQARPQGSVFIIQLSV